MRVVNPFGWITIYTILLLEATSIFCQTVNDPVPQIRMYEFKLDSLLRRYNQYLAETDLVEGVEAGRLVEQTEDDPLTA